MTASFLIRIDDVCPTMNWAAWDAVEAVLVAEGVRPILAVVPDNVDPTLMVAPAAADFWDRVRAWDARGWTVAMHGYQHDYVTADGGLLGLNPRSEFAGLRRAAQAEKLARSHALFAAHGLAPRVWVAPGHSFDTTTLDLLPGVGIDVVSDGAALFPFQDHRGLVWLPQQTERFVPAPVGMWTVCLHINRWDASRVQAFAAALHRHRRRLTNVEDMVARYGTRRRGAADRVVAAGLRSARTARRLIVSTRGT